MATTFSSSDHHDRVLRNYMDAWNGNLDLVDVTFSPDVALRSDRFPTPGGSSAPIEIASADALRAFVRRSRTGWDSYVFSVDRSVASGLQLAVRWRMDGVLGADFNLLPTTLKQGEKVSYHGTDFLVLNPRTGLIDEVDLAQDLLTLFHSLGLTSVTV